MARRCMDCASSCRQGAPHAGLGECRLDPPAMGRDIGLQVWPTVRGTDWCSRFVGMMAGSGARIDETERIAVAAMQALLPPTGMGVPEIAREAYDIADGMLRERFRREDRFENVRAALQ